ncbi:mechanosensitive ion channel [Lujinxingia vulgaris]|uniref:Mechanosensitive ion channel n=1 Tax=Lujinxingia vulgaris TaxID=2600176 RepID=A0A5C6XBG8_9DELT|nr:mechanosensitive ion channel domain-containing protein [Lujinxingia vulgaris]TXD35430.1 mechanosensitive ion channel [Lujinxingia vulgaris]
MEPTELPPAELAATSPSWFALALVVLAAALVSVGLRRLSTSGADRRLLRWLPLAQVGVWSLALIVILSSIARQGITAGLLLALAALAALIVAAAPLLRSVVAGLVLFGEARHQVGDTLEVGERRGVIEHLGARTLRLRDARGERHEIPYAELVDRPLTHLPHAGEVHCEMELEVPAELPVERALERVRTLASLTPYVAPRHRPEAFLVAQAAPGEHIRIRVRARVASAELVDHFRSDLLRRHRQAFSPAEPAEPLHA